MNPIEWREMEEQKEKLSASINFRFLKLVKKNLKREFPRIEWTPQKEREREGGSL